MASSSSSSKNPIAQGFAGGLAKKSLSPEQMEALFKEVSAFFAVLAEPSRLRIMYALCEGEKSVSEVMRNRSVRSLSIQNPAKQMCRVI
ncbi:MAG: hypothetical protein RL614_611 [Pseudomonadota bacterium]